ncbi:hypothetical protein M0805_007538 [Coniferiporia weirii]|nr:hypothetical protein M0805_007538 [Coniferiporia weirii]
MARPQTLLFAALLTSVALLAESQCLPSNNALFKFPPITAAGLTAHLVFGNLSTPRGIAFDEHGTLLVVERNVGVSAFSERNDSVCEGFDRTLVVNNSELTHGIVIEGAELYVSSQLQVLLYNYDTKTRTVFGTPKIIVKDLPSDGDLTTRTLLITPELGNAPRALLVSDGPLSNIDFTAQIPSNGRSQIRRFLLGPAGSFAPLVPTGGFSWTGFPGGKLIAFGIRNPAGLSLAPNPEVRPNELWVVENGASLNTVIGDSGSTDNPADELEFVELQGQSVKFYGFPFCHTGFAPLPAPFNVEKPGDQFSINSTTGRDNAYCRNPALNIPPRLIFQPHSVPLDIKFYRREDSPAPSPRGLPKAWLGNAFSSFHGSFDRVPPTGYGVVRIPWTSDGSGPIASPDSTTGYEFIIHVPDLTLCPDSCVRPVGLAFDRNGRLFVSSDSTGEVFYVQQI